MKFVCRIVGTVTVKAKNSEEAKQIANELSINDFSWSTIKVEDDE